MRALLGAGVTAFCLALSGAAWACEGSVVLLRHDFDTTSDLCTHTTDISTDEGKLVLESRPGKSEKMWATSRYDDVDICADVVVSAAPDLAAAYVGLGFWLTDNRNLYTFQITV